MKIMFGFLQSSLCCTVLLLIVYSSFCFGAGWEEFTDFEPELARQISEGHFGDSVAVSGDGNVIAVGMSGGGFFTGYVYLYTQDITGKWNYTIISPLILNPEDYFGHRVSLDYTGANIAITAHKTNLTGTVGAVYVYNRESQNLIQVVQPNPYPGDVFGISVEIGQGLLFVGSSGNNISGFQNAGAVYVFQQSGNNWNFLSTLIAVDGIANGQFGWSLSLSWDANFLVVGSSGNAVGRGAAYIFSGNILNSEITPYDVTNGTFFSKSVSIDELGRYLVLGYQDDSEFVANGGSAFVYEQQETTWRLVGHFRKTTPQLNDRFGYTVAISGDGKYIFISSMEAPSYSGAVYVYYRATTQFLYSQIITSSDSHQYDFFGWSVAISPLLQDLNSTSSSYTAVIGAVGAHGSSTANCGETYVFYQTGPLFVVPTLPPPPTSGSEEKLSLLPMVENLRSWVVWLTVVPIVFCLVFSIIFGVHYVKTQNTINFYRKLLAEGNLPGEELAEVVSRFSRSNSVSGKVPTPRVVPPLQLSQIEEEEDDDDVHTSTELGDVKKSLSMPIIAQAENEPDKILTRNKSSSLWSLSNLI